MALIIKMSVEEYDSLKNRVPTVPLGELGLTDLRVAYYNSNTNKSTVAFGYYRDSAWGDFFAKCPNLGVIIENGVLRFGLSDAAHQVRNKHGMYLRQARATVISDGSVEPFGMTDIIPGAWSFDDDEWFSIDLSKLVKAPPYQDPMSAAKRAHAVQTSVETLNGLVKAGALKLHVDVDGILKAIKTA